MSGDEKSQSDSCQGSLRESVEWNGRDQLSEMSNRSDSIRNQNQLEFVDPNQIHFFLAKTGYTSDEDQELMTFAIGCGDGPSPRQAAGTEVATKQEYDLESHRVLGEFGYRLVETGSNGLIKAETTGKRQVNLLIELSEKEKEWFEVLSQNTVRLTAFTMIKSKNGTKAFIRDIPYMSLNDILEESKVSQVSSCLAKKITKQGVEGLLYLESKGLVHRNLEPCTIFIFIQPFVVKIGGFERLLAIKERQVMAHDLLIETKNEMPCFAAPEIASQAQISERIDATKIDPYRVGVLLFRMLFGRYPDRENHPGEHVDSKIWQDSFTTVTEDCKKLIRSALLVNPRARASLAEICYSLWLKKPERHPKVTPFK